MAHYHTLYRKRHKSTAIRAFELAGDGARCIQKELEVNGNKHDVKTIAASMKRQALFEYIRVDYNRTRRPNALGYVSPVNFEKQYVA